MKNWSKKKFEKRQKFSTKKYFEKKIERIFVWSMCETRFKNIFNEWSKAIPIDKRFERKKISKNVCVFKKLIDWFND